MSQSPTSSQPGNAADQNATIPSLFGNAPDIETMEKWIYEDRENVEAIKFQEREFIQVPSTDDVKDCLNDLQNLECSSSTNLRKPRSFSSFGDEGTTATVNAYGNILQISRFLGDGGGSEVFAVDPAETWDQYEKPEPSQPGKRAEWLWDMSSEPTEGIGLQLEWPASENPPHYDSWNISYIRYRWPSFTFSTENFEVSLRYFVSKGAMVQQYVLKKKLDGVGDKTSTPDKSKMDLKENAQEDTAETIEGEQKESSRGKRTEEGCDRDELNLDNGKVIEHNKDMVEGTTQGNIVMSNAQEFAGANVDKTGNSTMITETSNESAGETLMTEVVDDLSGQDESVATPQQQNGMPTWPTLKLETNLLIRHLQWHTWNDFNSDSMNSGKYRVEIGPGGYTVVVVHERPPFANAASDQKTATPIADAVGLVIMPFINGRACQVKYSGLSDNWNKTPQYQIQYECAAGTEKLEIVVAYRLQLLHSTNNPWESVLLKAVDIQVADTWDTRLSEFSLSQASFLDFIMKRNLVHILDVCSIPIPGTPVWGFEQAKNCDGGSPKKDMMPIVALTCGDMSSHYFMHGASYFAFEFLLQIYAYIKGNFWTALLKGLDQKIEATCWGYLNWIFQADFKDGNVCCEYSITGKDLELSTYFEIHRETARHMIEAKRFADTIGTKDRTRELVKKHIDPWIKWLQRHDLRDNYVFGPEEYEEDRNFYLSDQIWIYAGLKAVEDLGFGHSLGIYSPREIQKKTRKRFTTENPVSKRRMLAPRRSALETCFKIESYDTPLFYQKSIFEDPTKYRFQTGSKRIQEWQNLLDAQVYHKDNQDSDWTAPSAYGVALLMAKEKQQINARSASNMFDESVRVLLCSNLSNGLFPGLLHRETKAPAFTNEFNQECDFWYDSFEMPYLIWKTLLGDSKGAQSRRHDQMVAASSSQDDQNSNRDTAMDNFVPFKRLPDHQSLIDSKYISEYSDEWLCECPDFLHYPHGNGQRSTTDNDVNSHSQNLTTSSTLDVSLGDLASSSNTVGLIAYHIREALDEKGEATSDETIQALSNNNLADQVCRWRTMRSEALIKKKLIWLPWGNRETRNRCIYAASDDEKPGLSAFFERHSSQEKFFFDDPTAADNIWVTEIHLSCYQWHEEKEAKLEAMIRKGTEMVQQKAFPLKGTMLSGESGTAFLRRSSMGFRFYGDFFDRYWNCHFVEHNRKETPARPADGNGTTDLLKSLEKIVMSRKELSHKKMIKTREPWLQRKLLELILFDEIIKEITECTNEILQKIRSELRNTKTSKSPSKGSLEDIVSDALFLSNIDSKTYFSLSRRWQFLEQLLQLLEEDLNETLSRISSWESREKDRGPERPRWTKKDEGRYRGSLRKMLVSNNQRVAQLRRLQATVQSLRASLTSKRDSIRDDLSLQGSEDVRYFTYVTVFFLPLGFAASIFSMNGAPAGSTVGGMSITAVIALFITGVALYGTSLYHKQKLAEISARLKGFYLSGNGKGKRNENRSIDEAERGFLR